MSQTQEYSIWLVPDEDTEEYKILSDLISEYSQKYPDSPDFKPHVTVVGGIEEGQEVVEERTQEITSEYTGLNLSFIDVSCSTTNHQCVFLLVDPPIELLKMYKRASGLLNRNVSMYTPHLSLIYSDMSFEDRIREVQSIELKSLPNSLQMDTIEVFNTTGAVPDWQKTGKYSLK